MFSEANKEALRDLVKGQETPNEVAATNTDVTPETVDNANEVIDQSAETKTETTAENPIDTTDENPIVEAEKPKEVVANTLPEDVVAKMKEHGFDSIEQLLEAANKEPKQKVELSDEEKTQKANEEKIEFEKHAVKNLKLTPEYLRKAESLQNAMAKDVVYDVFKADFVKANKDADEEDIQFAFDSQFPIDSEDEAIKEQAVKLLNLYKDKIVSSETEAYNKAKENFDSVQRIQSEEPKFKENVLNAIESAITDTIEIGTGEEKTNFKSTIKRDDVFKHLKAELGDEFIFDMFNRHLDGQLEQVSSMFKKLTNWAQKTMVFDDAVKAHGNKMKSIGLSEGALGSKAPFVKTENTTAVVAKGDLTRLNNLYGG